MIRDAISNIARERTNLIRDTNRPPQSVTMSPNLLHDLRRNLTEYVSVYQPSFDREKSDKLFGMQVIEDPSIPSNEVHLKTADGKVHRITNVGESDS